MRVAQTWAGAGFGFQFIPRVGMEVLVTFVRGDPDRPVIVGTLYNGIHETPEPLPVRKTRSAIRTQSSPEGGGFNELAFEDQAGLERVLLRSQKDLELVANDHHARTVRGGETVTVGGTQSVTVGNDQRTGVLAHQSNLVGGNQSASVRGDRTAYVARNEAHYVDGGRVEHVRGSTSRSIDGDATEGVNGSRMARVIGDDRTLVGADEAAPRVHHTRVIGSAVVAAHKVELHAEASDSEHNRFVYLTCGDSDVIVAKDEIQLSSKRVVIRGTDSVLVQGKDAILSLDETGAKITADPIHLTTTRGASLVLDKVRAKLHGSPVHIEPEPAEGVDDPIDRQRPSPNVKLRFTHGFLPGEAPTFKPGAKPGKGTSSKRTRQPTALANVRVKMSSARCDATETDGDGNVECYVQAHVKTFTVSLFAHEKFPDLYAAADGPLTYLVKLEDELPAPTTPAGARFRLRNMGYEPGPELGAKRVDPSTEAALMEFQFDRAKPRTGSLDDALANDLDDVWTK